MSRSTPESEPHQRLDTWLWHARIARSREACADLASRGRVRINRQETNKPHAKIRIGDILTLPTHPRPNVKVIRVTGFSERRVSAKETAALYEDIPE